MRVSTHQELGQSQRPGRGDTLDPGTTLLGHCLHLSGISANLPCIHSYNTYV